MGNAAPITFRTSARSGGGGSASRLRSGHCQGRRAVPRGASPGLGRGLCTPGRPSTPHAEAVAGPRRSEAGKRPRHAGDAARPRPPRSRRVGSTHRWLARRSARLRAARRDERDGRPLLVATPSAAAPGFATAGSQRRAGASFRLRHPEAQPGASGVAGGLRASAPPAPACPRVRGSRGRHRDRLCAAPPTARPSGGKSAARAARALARLQTPRGFAGPDGPSARPAEARPGVPRAPA